MSWIIGKYSKKDNIIDDLNCSKSLLNFNNKNFIIYVGGFSENIIYSENFAICGIPISNDSSIRILNNNDWNKILNSINKSDQIENLNGHFVGFQILNDELFIFTDALGTRNIYFFQRNDEFYFSSKPEFLLKIQKQNSLNFKNFITRISLSVQINQGSIFDNIERLTSNARIYLNRDIFKHSFSFYKPAKIESNEEKISETIFNLMSIMDRITLGLSGGLDSRLLLSLLLKNNSKFSLYSFGYSDHPDIKISKRISENFQLKHKFFDDKLNKLNSNVLIELTEKFIIDTEGTSLASESIQKSYYSEFYENELLILDGGFGEILRRGLFNRLLFNKNDILNKNIDNLFNSLITSYPKFFNSDLSSKIEYFTKLQIDDTLNQMPNINDFGFENWLDLLSIRTKLVNYTGIEQSRTDDLAKVLTPYQQKIIFDLNFSLDPKLRKNSKLFKNIISKSNKELQKFPLVKGTITHPYYFNTLTSKIFTKFIKSIKKHRDKNQDLFLLKIKEFILDEINSVYFNTNEYFNHKYILKKVSAYYKNSEDGNFVDSFLSFYLLLKFFDKKN